MKNNHSSPTNQLSLQQNNAVEQESGSANKNTPKNYKSTRLFLEFAAGFELPLPAALCSPLIKTCNYVGLPNRQKFSKSMRVA